MLPKPLFSVLIANYNNGKYLEDAIKSVLRQTYDNWELIIVDDGSTDNSAEIYCKYLNDNRIKYYYNDHNEGCGYAKRKCVELANGIVLGFLDADDIILPKAIESMVFIHNKFPNVSIAFSRYYECDEQLRIIKESRRLKIPPGKSYLTHGDFKPEVFASFKKKFYDKTVGISGSLLRGVDQDLYLKLEEVGDIFISEEVTYMYRMHQSNISISQGLKALYWNIIVRHDACIRRNINPEEISYKNFYDEINNRYYMGLNAKSNSIHSKIGIKVLKAFRKYRKFFLT